MYLKTRRSALIISASIFWNITMSAKFQCHHRPVKDMLRHYTPDSMVECKLNCSMDAQSICKSPITCCPIGLLRKQHNARVNSPVSKTCMKYCAGVLFRTDILFLIYIGYSFSEGWQSYKHLYIVYAIIMSACNVQAMTNFWRREAGCLTNSNLYAFQAGIYPNQTAKYT